MIAFIDCEFDGYGGDLISMALVDLNGVEFYEVIERKDDTPYSDWVESNVVPYLNKPAISLTEFQNKLEEFLLQYESICIVADWPDDIKYLCQSMITGPGVAIQCPSEITMNVNFTLGSGHSKIPHNALADAIAIKDMWLMKYFK